jgi:hypothetical protein
LIAEQPNHFCQALPNLGDVFLEFVTTWLCKRFPFSLGEKWVEKKDLR